MKPCARCNAEFAATDLRDNLCPNCRAELARKFRDAVDRANADKPAGEDPREE